VEVQDEDFLEHTASVVHHYEFPFSGHPHSVPFLLVSKLVRENNVKAVLTGEGADENFLGYNHLAYEPLWQRYYAALNKVRGWVNKVPVIGANLWPGTSKPDLVADMLTQFNSSAESRLAHELFSSRTGRPADGNVRSLTLHGYHLRTLLHRNDTMGMAASIEARFPFLDEDLVETAFNLPERHKIKFSLNTWEREHPLLRDKWVVRKVAERYMPPLLSRRKKWGFDVSAFRRMKVARSFFDGSFVGESFSLDSKAGDQQLD
jgi:asparagine synthase (glutamine-hydrolysing)